MVGAVWGQKIGMTQVFSNDSNRAIPVTAIDLGNWLVTGIKTKERDGYDALQVGILRKRFREKGFVFDWLKDLKTYFLYVREIKAIGCDELAEYAVGSPIDPRLVVADGDMVNVVGVTRGLGFAGVIKRHGFNGPPGSHGSTMGNRPGTNGSLRRCGKVIKGKKLPGRAGGVRRTLKNLSIVKTGLQDGQVILLHGSVPGKTGSLVCLYKV